MSSDQPALEAPITGTEPAADPVLAAPTISAADKLAAEEAARGERARLNAQPKVKIRVPQIFGEQVVIINGCRFNVPANVYVEVPEQVAGILRDAGRI